MSSEPETPSRQSRETDEKQLCMSCMFPNEPAAHFCIKCGAPLTPYAATGPFESLLAEGHVHRQAAERPQSFIVLLGIWMIFGACGLTGVVLVAVARDSGLGYVVVGALFLALSFQMIAKTTRNYFASTKRDERPDA